MTETQKFPIPSAEREDLEEALGLVWHKREKGELRAAEIKNVMDQAVGEGAYARILQDGFARESGAQLVLLPPGESLAADITRRHRLAERLLTDVLSLDRQAVDPNACQLEHIISPEVTDSICTLLGHPKECPHGHAIPQGECCRRAEKQIAPIVAPLTEMKPGEKGTVAYLQLKDHPELHKLLALGMVPGTPLHLHQTFPAYVVDIGESQLALEEVIAGRIFVHRARA